MSNSAKLDWADFKTVCASKSLPMQWVIVKNMYWIKAFDGPYAYETVLRISDPATEDEEDFVANFKDAGNKKLDPKDTDGSTLQRAKVTTTGWHLQLHSLEVRTSTWDGYRNKSIDPATLIETDLGFVTFKLFDANRVQITDPAQAATAKYTQIDWCVNHDMGIIGAILAQAEPPTSDIYMYTIGAPGIANVKFGTGGLNLACVGIGGVIDADGKAEKFLSPTLPVPGVNKFRTIFVHDVGTVHKCQLIYKLFKPT